MDNLRKLGSQFSISLAPDSQGYLGRECPIEACLGYFKITPGTGLKSPAPCHCPYCGHSGEAQTFTTKEQIEYAKSVVIRKVTNALHQDLKSLEFEHKPRGAFGIGISMKVKASAPHPIRHYRERQLETEVTCDNCTLRYAIYGVFGWCPDCGAHNSLQILRKNLELAQKELLLAETADKELAEYLIGDALENVVSAFDGFGREICSSKAAGISFQNIAGARERVEKVFGFDFADGLGMEDWTLAVQIFQKRHVLAHKMGVADEEYVRKSSDAAAVAGRKIIVTPEEVTSAVRIVETLGRRLVLGTARSAE